MLTDAEIKVEAGNILIRFMDRNKTLAFCFRGIISNNLKIVNVILSFNSSKVNFVSSFIYKVNPHENPS